MAFPASPYDTRSYTSFAHFNRGAHILPTFPLSRVTSSIPPHIPARPAAAASASLASTPFPPRPDPTRCRLRWHHALLQVVSQRASPILVSQAALFNVFANRDLHLSEAVAVAHLAARGNAGAAAGAAAVSGPGGAASAAGGPIQVHGVDVEVRHSGTHSSPMASDVGRKQLTNFLRRTVLL